MNATRYQYTAVDPGGGASPILLSPDDSDQECQRQPSALGSFLQILHSFIMPSVIEP